MRRNTALVSLLVVTGFFLIALFFEPHTADVDYVFKHQRLLQERRRAASASCAVPAAKELKQLLRQAVSYCEPQTQIAGSLTCALREADTALCRARGLAAAPLDGPPAVSLHPRCKLVPRAAAGLKLGGLAPLAKRLGSSPAGAGSAACAATVDQPVYLIQLAGNSSRAASPDDVRHALTAWKMWNWTRAAGVQLAFDLDPGTVGPTPSQMAVWKKALSLDRAPTTLRDLVKRHSPAAKSAAVAVCFNDVGFHARLPAETRPACPAPAGAATPKRAARAGSAAKPPAASQGQAAS